MEVKKEWVDEYDNLFWIGYSETRPTVQECQEAYGPVEDCAIQSEEDVDKLCSETADGRFRVLLGNCV